MRSYTLATTDAFLKRSTANRSPAMSHREAPSCNGSQQESQKLTGDAAGETPRTDAAEFDWSIIQGREYKTKRVVSAGFARQLERESSSLKAQLEGFRKAIRDANDFGVIYKDFSVHAEMWREIHKSAIDSALHHDTDR
jgi:hypothetical protein